ncbi:MAG: hypothetical protein R3189_05280 [Thiomicrorhabdus chilensis]|uniref:hypothetical protein n=1 Tax=Thiomicrorhabdus chilensis TaxID=63656 RepID=UPI00299CF436|nr:hypothetical protein [Thiomicrorhabdus chilensis]MDX1347643.1 hypothetical protein [Thiomicrorhabdus chilensis]
MKRLFTAISAGLLTTLLVSCASSPYPLDMNEEQWQKLSPQEREVLLIKHQEFRETQRLEQIKANAKQQELEMALKLKQEERLNKLYSDPAGGNVIMVNLLGGEYRSHKKSYSIQPFSTLLARGETKRIELVMRDAKRRSNTERAYLKYNVEGTGLYLYMSRPSDYNRDYIAVLRDGHWACGSSSRKSFAFSSYEALNNLKIFVQEQNSNCHSRRYR